MSKHYLRIRHQSTGAVIAAGPLGCGITPFEGNCYISRAVPARRSLPHRLHTRAVHLQGLYIGMDYVAPDQSVAKHLGWLYWLPNPLFPFIMFRVAVPACHPLLEVYPMEASETPEHSRS